MIRRIDPTLIRMALRDARHEKTRRLIANFETRLGRKLSQEEKSLTAFYISTGELHVKEKLERKFGIA